MATPLDDDPIEWLHETGITTCPTCGTQREILDFEDIPQDAKPEVDLVAGEDDFYLYCPTCNTYTIGGFGGSEFDNTHYSKSLSFTPKTSLNAPCPCGSGKKYKRCCGKQ